MRTLILPLLVATLVIVAPDQAAASRSQSLKLKASSPGGQQTLRVKRNFHGGLQWKPRLLSRWKSLPDVFGPGTPVPPSPVELTRLGDLRVTAFPDRIHLPDLRLTLRPLFRDVWRLYSKEVPAGVLVELAGAEHEPASTVLSRATHAGLLTRAEEYDVEAHLRRGDTAVVFSTLPPFARRKLVFEDQAGQEITLQLSTSAWW